MFKEILAFFKKLIHTLAKFLGWLYHNLFMRLWLAFAGLIGISTASACPCCGQVAAACPAGFSLVAGLAAVLAAFGFFQKKARTLLRKIFPFLTENGSRYVFWGLILAALIACSVLGFRLFGKHLVQKEWSPVQQKAVKQASAPVLSDPSLDLIPAAKGIGIKDSSAPSGKTPPSIVPASHVKPAELLQETELPTQMRATIHPDGSIEIQKAPEGLVRYETWNFMELNDDIYERLTVYRGKKVEIEGFVYRRSDFEPGYFVTARLYMWCCAADAAPVGPLCKWDRASELKDGDWIRVGGTIEPMLFHDTFEDASGDIPLIKVEKVERIPKRGNPFVYLRGTPPPPRPEHTKPSS